MESRAQAVIGQAFEGKGDVQIGRVKGVFKHRNGRERTVEDAISVDTLEATPYLDNYNEGIRM